MGTVLSLITLAKTRPMFGSVSRAPTRPMLLAPALTASWPGAQNASTRAASPGAIVSLGPTTRLRLTKPFGPAGPKGPHWPMGQGDRPSIHQYQWHRKSRRPPSRSSTACRAPCGKRAASAWTWTLSSSSTRRSWSASTTSRPGFREPAPWAVRSRVDQSKKLSARALSDPGERATRGLATGRGPLCRLRLAREPGVRPHRSRQRGRIEHGTEHRAALREVQPTEGRPGLATPPRPAPALNQPETLNRLAYKEIGGPSANFGVNLLDEGD
jgi:hypothetical protein